MKRYKLILRYDGHDYHGWQKQEPPDCEPLRTVQAVTELAVCRAVREPVVLTGASRTDAGVHAQGQVAAFTVEDSRIPVERLHYAINKWLPDDIVVLSAEEADLEFNPINGAVSKAYKYTIYNEQLRPVFDRYRMYHCWLDINVERMHEAAQLLVGTHDFESFANAQHGRESTIRTIFSCGVSQAAIGGNRIVYIDVVGSGFLYHMVRIIAGTLIEIGRGHWEVDYITDIINACDRQKAGTTLPPEGLCLQWIKYDADP